MGCSGCAKRREWLKKWTKIAYERATGKRADSSAERTNSSTERALLQIVGGDKLIIPFC